MRGTSDIPPSINSYKPMLNCRTHLPSPLMNIPSLEVTGPALHMHPPDMNSASFLRRTEARKINTKHKQRHYKMMYTILDTHWCTFTTCRTYLQQVNKFVSQAALRICDAIPSTKMNNEKCCMWQYSVNRKYRNLNCHYQGKSFIIPKRHNL